MAIGLDNQYYFQFSLGNLRDFIAEGELIEFTLHEQAGNVLPTFRLTFLARQERVLQLLSETTNIELTFGKSQQSEDLSDIKLSPTSIEATAYGNSQRLIACVGVISQLPYANNTELFISEPKSGIQVIKDRVTSLGFFSEKNFESNIVSDADLAATGEQRWIQANTTTRKFVSDICLHSLSPTDTFIACGISSDNKLIIKDIGTLVKDTVGVSSNSFRGKWNFTPTASRPNDIVYDPTPIIKTKTGLNNQIVGYGRKELIYNLDSGETAFFADDPKPLISNTKEIARQSEVKRRFHAPVPLSDNVHENYNIAAQKNRTRNIVIGNINVALTFSNTFKPVRILDLVSFRESDIGASGSDQAAEYHSGLYIVCSVMRTLKNRKFITQIEICRESFNQITGNVLENNLTAAEQAKQIIEDQLVQENS